MNIRDIIRLIENATAVMTLDMDGQNEEEFLQSLMQVDGKLSVRYNARRDGYEITSNDDPNIQAFVPDGATVGRGVLRDEPDVCEWLYQAHLTPDGY